MHNSKLIQKQVSERKVWQSTKQQSKNHYIQGWLFALNSSEEFSTNATFKMLEKYRQALLYIYPIIIKCRSSSAGFTEWKEKMVKYFDHIHVHKTKTFTLRLLCHLLNVNLVYLKGLQIVTVCKNIKGNFTSNKSHLM